ncbi:MAG TPA: hypothetical protein VKB48_12055 [Candidatus Acidoferrum sp.]|nr:hypothetical protein [Candidatus Acidoferrum sp.]
MAEIDREKQERDKQIRLFIQKTLKGYLRRARRTRRKSKPNKVNLDQPMVNITPEEMKQADGVIENFPRRRPLKLLFPVFAKT